ncbi:hypothetical protein ACFQMA_18700 [Halosimplex aquaticum]|uniref:Uncharacterized protein n=1 Tax=Halosimplex aquaticum TaxID=3026162 RepID=A0ABD5Y800_9EURY|nr:hypothetical protein [Halosimplex aquaticum]
MSSFSAGGDDPSAAELAVVTVSVAVTLALFGYIGWHAATTPANVPPEVSVTGTQTMDDGRVRVTAELYNPSATGLDTVTVGVDCGDTPITFRHVPTAARVSGTFVCPAGTDDPSVSVENWVESQGARTN